MEAIRVMEQRNNVTLAGKWIWDRTATDMAQTARKPGGGCSFPEVQSSMSLLSRGPGRPRGSGPAHMAQWQAALLIGVEPSNWIGV
jgi:hypothetical protein